MMNQQRHLKISAALCTYRRPDVLPAAIESLLAQSLPTDQYEILIVDNNSQDETVSVVQKYVQDNPLRVRYVLEIQQGLSCARNTAVRLALADTIAFLDDDAVADSDWLDSLVEAYDGNASAWAVGGKVLPIWDGERPGWLNDSMLRSLSLLDWGDQCRPLQWPERIIGTNCSFKKQVFSEVGHFATELGRMGTLLLGNEDTEIQERIHALGGSVIYAPRAIVHHHVPAVRMTKRYFYRRAYGTGRSEAILAAQRGGARELLRGIARVAVGLPIRWLVLVRDLPWADKRFRRLRLQAYYLGFLDQAARLLLSRQPLSGPTQADRP
jgi:glycosyltransferase involved in cell wall biosynthesis